MADRDTPTATFAVDGYPYRMELFGAVDTARMREEFNMAVELFEQAIEEHGLVAGDVPGHLLSLCATAYALGAAQQEGDNRG